MLTSRSGRRSLQSALLRVSRSYHDESFGFRQRRKTQIPDYTPSQLANRATNAHLLRYVDSLRMHGHRAAQIDPLDILQREEVPALDPRRYGLTDDAVEYPIEGIIWTDGPGALEKWSLAKITKYLRDIYVGRLAIEYMHSPEKNERLWFSHFLESEVNHPREKVVDPERQKRMWELLAKSEAFDQFLQIKFPNLKRYGLEGAESMLVYLDNLFRLSSQVGIEHIIIGMPHRGRLNLLTDLLKYEPVALFHKIKGGSEVPEELGVAGDVISHLAASPTLSYEGSKKGIKVSLLQNPSHLEAVNPVALGKTRAKQFSLIKQTDPSCMLGDKVMCLQIHGDAAFTGQGVVMESFGLSNLPHYTSGGSIHLVVNNNIGYTTPASSARSSLYCSDIGKMINAPVIHVNGDFPEDVARAVNIALQYRNAFRKDIVVDLITYRRWGHNELDEPAFTQPQMYQKIRNRKSVPKLYEDKLIADRVITEADVDTLRTSYKSHLESHLSRVESFVPQADMLQAQWSNIVWPGDSRADHHPKTGLPRDELLDIGKASVAVPEGFELHSRLQRHVKHRLTSLETGKGIDWGTAEALAFGSLLREGQNVRISGQDVGRGTFSHRHAMLVDQVTEGVIVPLNNNGGLEHGRLELANSSLSEMAVLGFEYGMSWENPNLLPIWEAQFGDFFNGAQVIIDTFISSSETKWLKQSGIVMLLPHGLDGAGPEHSSMRIERMLQLTNDTFTPYKSANATINMTVANPTTPSQYFHLLRRQMKRNYRKPLIVAAPKGLLRSPVAASSIEEFEPSSQFHPIIADPTNPSSPERVFVVSGKFYYDLVRERQARKMDSEVAIIRVEQLAPFPFQQMEEILRSVVGTAKSVTWVQEEARNQGAYAHVAPRLQAVLGGLEGGHKLGYVGRPEAAVPAVGVGKLHAFQSKSLFDEAFAN